MARPTELLWSNWRRRREARSFEELVKPHLPHVLDVARHQGCDAAEAEDVVQEALLLLAREQSDEPVRVGLRPWLARRVRFRARKSLRSLGRRRRHERSAGQRLTRGDPDKLEVRDEVEAALSLLRPAERQAVVLRYLHDMDYEEIAYVLGVSVNACRLKVHKAIGKLRRSLGGHAAALVAALGLPQVCAESLIQGAVSAAATTKTIAAGGAIVMSTGIKLAGAAALGAAVTAVGMLALPQRADSPRARSPRNGSHTARPSLAEATESSSLSDLRPTADEVAWLRRTLQAERVRRESARIRPEDSGLDILKRVVEHGADVSELIRDFERFQGHVRPAQGKTVRVQAQGDVTTVNLEEVAADAVLIEFGAGTFKLDRNARQFHYPRGDIKQLEIRGVGMDRTIIVSGDRGLLTPLGRIEHLRIHDLTFDGGRSGDELLDIRGNVAVIFENVRFRAWSSGGYSAPVGLSGGAYLGCRNCEWLGGYRGQKGHTAVAVRGTAVASLKGCLFADVETVVQGWEGAAAKSSVHIEGCVFENSRLADNRFLHQGKPEFPISVRGGEVFYESREKWGAEFAAELVDVAFREHIPRCRLQDLLRVARAFPLEEGQRLQGVQVVAAFREPPREFLVWVWSPSDFVRRQHEQGKQIRREALVTIDASGRLKVEPVDRRRRLRNFGSGRVIEGGRSITDVIGRAGLDPSLEAYGIVQSGFGTTDGTVPAIEVRDARGHLFLVLHGVTGEVLRRRDR